LANWTNSNTDAADLVPIFELQLFANFRVMRVTPEFVYHPLSLKGSCRTHPNALVTVLAKV